MLAPRYRPARTVTSQRHSNAARTDRDAHIQLTFCVVIYDELMTCKICIAVSAVVTAPIYRPVSRTALCLSPICRLNTGYPCWTINLLTAKKLIHVGFLV